MQWTVFLFYTNALRLKLNVDSSCHLIMCRSPDPIHAKKNSQFCGMHELASFTGDASLLVGELHLFFLFLFHQSHCRSILQLTNDRSHSVIHFEFQCIVCTLTSCPWCTFPTISSCSLLHPTFLHQFFPNWAAGPHLNLNVLLHNDALHANSHLVVEMLTPIHFSNSPFVVLLCSPAFPTLCLSKCKSMSVEQEGALTENSQGVKPDPSCQN